MVIISESNEKQSRRYRSAQYRYTLIYICITFAVLIFLNIYTSGTSQKLFYQSKENSMIEKCLLASSEIANLDVLNPATASAAVNAMNSLRVSRLIITDQSGIAVYDSLSEGSRAGSYVLLPEVIRAMDGYNVFSWHYHDGTMQSRAATPVLHYGTLVGCVYMMEYDTEQGALIQSLQSNILSITLILELVVIIFSIAFSNAFSRRLNRFLTSMRIIREGDYSHKVKMGGRDELSLLGDEFNQLTEKLQISENKRHQFVSDASHELKTPLASIKLLSDSILQNDMDMETVREFVSDIGNESERLNRMSQKLLSLSRIEGQLDSDCEIIYMTPTIQQVVRMLSGIAEKSQVTIVTELENDSPILILEDDLYQIAFNLVENGIKYNVPGGKLTVSLGRDEENAFLRFEDTGVGIPKESISHVFERFYRVDKARSRTSGGSGLGLAIVRSMVRRNGGDIHVESDIGKGTCFTVTFPYFDEPEDEL
ncbi:MAG: HAMP domain-containing histidine kinase [Oscillospiraceae bacterium]|nr:HAMP domain-containing histidine kinase [Oscillospiraceae bacterium]